MAEAAALPGLGWVAHVMKDLVAKSISYLGNDIAKDLEDLATTVLPQIQLTMEAAQHSPPNQKALLTRWLARLKNAYYDAEGILHELEYERLKHKVKGEDNKLLVRLSSKLIIKPLTKFIGPVVKKASLLSPRKRELLQRLNKLKEVAAEGKNFRDLLKDLKQVAAEAKTESKDDKAGNRHSDTSSILTDKVFGRDGYRDEIINFLLDDGERYSVIAVAGMGGIGKTTLAQYVYNNEKVQNFGVKMWLCLSQNLDINERTKEMIECASGKECPNLRNLDALQNKLTETLSQSDSIIAVLDDFWYDNNDRIAEENKWENLLKPFIKFASQGGTCKIVVTSRSSRFFPNALKPKNVIELRDLALDDFKSLLNYRAIDGLEIADEQLKKDLSKIVEQIAEKMSKSPLAAKVVGNQLREQPNIRFWQATLENVNLSDITAILLWSFNRFDVQLQRCFIFCSVFPKGTKFHFGSFVRYWVALDFIQPSNDNRNVEDIGREYFQIMVENSIFQLVDKKYIMHDLFHDLAENISAEDCFRVTNAEREIPSTVQHIYLKVNNENQKKILSSMSHLSNLRTIILGNPFIDDISEIISMISTNFRNLRVLDVRSRGYKTLPKVVGDFKNLRFLNLQKSSIEELPDSVVQLYHLQFLYLPSSVKTLPTKLSNLIKLRSILMAKRDGFWANKLPPVPYLGKSTSLQYLDEFHVRKMEGYELHQLGPLKEIGGSLRIKNLHNVGNKDEAVKAMLIDKPKLKRIELVWDESAENGSELEVIEALQPPPNLEMLSIVQYRGSTYPTWFQEDCFTDNVKNVELYSCNALTTIPQKIQQFSHCSVLILQHLDALREWSTIPESLTTLTIIKCPCLIFVCENELSVDENQSIMERRFLRDGIGSCKYILHQELKSFKKTGSKENCAEQLQIMESAARDDAPKFPVNLNVNRAWWCCHQQRMNFIFSCNTQANKLKLPSRLRFLSLGYCCVSDGALSDCLSGMTALKKLYLEGIMTITTLPPTQVLKPLKRLRVVEIKDCWYIRSLGGLHALPHLESFLLHGCLCLEMESGYTSRKLPSTLQSLSISSCVVSQAIFNSDLPCLHNVAIEKCHTPQCLSFCKLTLLKSLTLHTCPNLVSIRGLELRPFINCLRLIELPNLAVESALLSWQGFQKLVISSSVMLNKFLLSQDFVPPKKLVIHSCQEEVISFEKSDHLQSIKILGFSKCKTSRLPETLSDFSTLETIGFKDCQNISGLPELPSSVKFIGISGCPVLSKRCPPKGADWHKIQNIEDKWIY